MNAADLAPIAHEARTQSPFDLFLIFAGASIVATTWQVGASLGTISTSAAIGIIAIGSLIGASFTSLLAPVGVTLSGPTLRGDERVGVGVDADRAEGVFEQAQAGQGRVGHGVSRAASMAAMRVA